jgi:hypothetical protein
MDLSYLHILEIVVLGQHGIGVTYQILTRNIFVSGEYFEHVFKCAIIGSLTFDVLAITKT